MATGASGEKNTTDAPTQDEDDDGRKVTENV